MVRQWIFRNGMSLIRCPSRKERADQEGCYGRHHEPGTAGHDDHVDIGRRQLCIGKGDLYGFDAHPLCFFYKDLIALFKSLKLHYFLDRSDEPAGFDLGVADQGFDGGPLRVIRVQVIEYFYNPILVDLMWRANKRRFTEN